MRTRLLSFTLVAVFAGAATVAAIGGFYDPSADGTVVPAPATAYLTCYAIDHHFQFVSANTSRPDILATFVQKSASTPDAPDAKVCFLRPTVRDGGEWTVSLSAEMEVVRPSPPPPTGPCPLGMVAGIYGGCVPPDHPLVAK